MPPSTRKRAPFCSTESKSEEAVVSMRVSWHRRACRKLLNNVSNNV
jgi:hypothetical protein